MTPYQIVQSQSKAQAEDSLIWLASYCSYIRHDERAFFGINYDGRPEQFQVLDKYRRDTFLHYLSEAQRKIETELNFFIMPKWVSENAEDDFYRDNNKKFIYPVLTRWGYLIEPGIRVNNIFDDGVMIDHTSDPAVIGPVAVPSGCTNSDEIHIYHPGTTVEIPVSSISLAGGLVTIEIPRARLVATNKQNNPESGWDYDDTTASGAFEQTVDLWWTYNSGSTHAHLVATNSNCGLDEVDACITIENAVIGRISLKRATYSGGSWTTTALCEVLDSGYDRVNLNYYCGLQTFDKQLVDAVIRLANANMPDQPTANEFVQGVWVRDGRVPTGSSRERLDCPFGLGDGAWAAWQDVRHRRLVRGSLP